MNVVFFLNKLHDHVSADDYEEWVRTVDYPTARSLPSIREYTVVRTNGLLEGDGPAPYQYIERVLITDLEAYQQDLRNPGMEDFGKQWGSYVAESIAVRGMMIE